MSYRIKDVEAFQVLEHSLRRVWPQAKWVKLNATRNPEDTRVGVTWGTMVLGIPVLLWARRTPSDGATTHADVIAAVHGRPPRGVETWQIRIIAPKLAPCAPDPSRLSSWTDDVILQGWWVVSKQIEQERAYVESKSWLASSLSSLISETRDLWDQVVRDTRAPEAGMGAEDKIAWQRAMSCWSHVIESLGDSS